ncbi:hypothetical protein CBR_g38245 [Chara braunii]|uniref:Uncharacterized protein n=1 Tax=Chara braunii TaxID=69332 RepID=A0A388LPP8_CHABU|nr:hypothetical protein CBR_g38245 [Chara braunii]|eukprot:GBG84274.1 hypothetical protein CBR_g38245 [Chara braunii]
MASPDVVAVDEAGAMRKDADCSATLPGAACHVPGRRHSSSAPAERQNKKTTTCHVSETGDKKRRRGGKKKGRGGGRRGGTRCRGGGGGEEHDEGEEHDADRARQEGGEEGEEGGEEERTRRRTKKKKKEYGEEQDAEVEEEEEEEEDEKDGGGGGEEDKEDEEEWEEDEEVVDDREVEEEEKEREEGGKEDFDMAEEEEEDHEEVVRVDEVEEEDREDEEEEEEEEEEEQDKKFEENKKFEGGGGERGRGGGGGRRGEGGRQGGRSRWRGGGGGGGGGRRGGGGGGRRGGKGGGGRRVCNDLGNLRKGQLEKLCTEEEIDYVGVKKTAADLADIYTNRAFARPTNRRLISDDEREEHVDGDLDGDDSVDVAGVSADASLNSESSQPGHFVRDSQLRQIPNVAALLSGNGGEGAANGPHDNDGLLPAPNALVPYRPPQVNGGQSDGSRQNQGANHGYGSQQGQGYGNNQAQGSNYYRGGYQQRPLSNWWSENRERERDDKLEKVWGWYSEEMEAKDRERRDKEQKLKEEEEKEIIQAIEEERAKAKRECEEFEQSIDKMVRESMKEVCGEVVRKKANTSQASVATVDAVDRSFEARQVDELRKQQEERWRREDSAAREQVEKRSEIEVFKRSNKRTSEAVREKSPPTEPAKGKSHQQEGSSTPADWAKLAKKYRKIRDEKDMAEREVSALKERINRIKIATPSSIKRKVSFRRRSHKVANSPGSKNGDQVRVTFVRKVGEERDAFYKRVCNDIGKLRKGQLEKLCTDEEIDYAGVKKTAADLVDIYTNRAFDRPTNQQLISDDEREEHVDGDPDGDDSVDVAGVSADASLNSESS